MHDRCDSCISINRFPLTSYYGNAAWDRDGELREGFDKNDRGRIVPSNVADKSIDRPTRLSRVAYDDTVPALF